MKRSSFFSVSLEETLGIAETLGRSLGSNSVVALTGDLGSGKTTFVKGLVKGLGVRDPDEVSSPTFSYLNIYKARLPVFHFDLYRLQNALEFEASGFEEYFVAGGVSCIEWPEFAGSSLPKEAIFVDLWHRGEHLREIVINQHSG